MADGVGENRRCEAATAVSSLPRAVVRRRAVHRYVDRVARGVKCEGKTRTGLDPEISELAAGLRSRVRTATSVGEDAMNSSPYKRPGWPSVIPRIFVAD